MMAFLSGLRGRLFLAALASLLAVSFFITYQHGRQPQDLRFLSYCRAELGRDQICNCLEAELLKSPDGRALYNKVIENRALMLFVHMPAYQEAGMRALAQCQ